MYTNWIVNVPTQRPYISFVSVVRFDFESRQLCVDADSNVNFKWIFINNVYGHRECWKAHERQVSGYSCYYIYTYIWRMAAPISDDYYIITHRESVLYTMFSCWFFLFLHHGVLFCFGCFKSLYKCQNKSKNCDLFVSGRV